MTKYPLPPLGLAQPQCHNIDRIITVTYRRKGVTGSASISVKKSPSASIAILGLAWLCLTNSFGALQLHPTKQPDQQHHSATSLSVLGLLHNLGIRYARGSRSDMMETMST